jgi:hypothetical protein
VSAESRRRISFCLSLFAPGLPLVFTDRTGRGLFYFFGFWVSLVIFFPIAIFIYLAALGDCLE